MLKTNPRTELLFMLRNVTIYKNDDKNIKVFEKFADIHNTKGTDKGKKNGFIYR